MAVVVGAPVVVEAAAVDAGGGGGGRQASDLAMNRERATTRHGEAIILKLGMDNKYLLQEILKLKRKTYLFAVEQLQVMCLQSRMACFLIRLGCD